METETSNNLIVRYLLGDLPEAEQVQIEDRAFADRDYRRTLEEAENDLIDDYVRGALTASEQRQFERRFLVSAERQKKVEFARALARVVPTISPQPSPQPVQAHWWEAWRAFFSSAYPVVQFSMAAAALMLLLGVTWLFTVTRGLRTEIAQLQAQQQTQQQQEILLREQSARERARNEELAAQLARERAQNQELAQQLKREQVPATAPTTSLLLSLFLPPNAVGRNDDKLPKLLIPPQAQTVRLQIGLERGDDFKSYSVQITAPGQPVWERHQLHPRGRTISLTLPTKLLHTGQYEIAVKGVTAAQQTEDVRFYYFDVLKK